MKNPHAYVSLKPGVIFRRRSGLRIKVEESDVVVDSSGRTYFLDTETAEFLTNCNGTKEVEEIENFASMLKRYPKLASLLTTVQSKCLDCKQIVVTPAMSAACRVAIWHTTRKCNLSCSHCYYLYDGDRKSEFDKNSVPHITANLHRLGVELVRVSGGEPTISQAFPEIINSLETHKLPYIINTNGMQLTTDQIQTLIGNAYLRSVQVSLDGPESAHNQLRGGNGFGKVTENIRRLCAAGVYVRIISMLHDQWMEPDKVVDFANLLNHIGVDEWIVEVPSATGLSGQNATTNEDEILKAAMAMREWCGSSDNKLKYVEFTQVFDWPPQKYTEKKLTDSVCSHDLGLLTFGKEGISYCSLFREQFGAEWKDFAQIDGQFDEVLNAWERIASARTDKRIEENPYCSTCHLFDDCQGGCPGQYSSPSKFEGCDLHSRALAIIKRRVQTFYPASIE